MKNKKLSVIKQKINKGDNLSGNKKKYQNLLLKIYPLFLQNKYMKKLNKLLEIFLKKPIKKKKVSKVLK